MCDLSKGFKLCTCAGETLEREELDWTLQRKNEQLPLQHRRGKAAMPRFSNEEKALKKEILNFLNHGNCFDFDYNAQEDDFLRLRIHKKNNRWAAFRFVKGVWTNDLSTSLSSWRSQLTNFEKGKVKSNSE